MTWHDAWQVLHNQRYLFALLAVSFTAAALSHRWGRIVSMLLVLVSFAVFFVWFNLFIAHISSCVSPNC